MLLEVCLDSQPKETNHSGLYSGLWTSGSDYLTEEQSRYQESTIALIIAVHHKDLTYLRSGSRPRSTYCPRGTMSTAA